MFSYPFFWDQIIAHLEKIIPEPIALDSGISLYNPPNKHPEPAFIYASQK
jgi:hypothetical protein